MHDHESAVMNEQPMQPNVQLNSHQNSTATQAGYMPGFGNDFETEALPGALPVGRNSPRRCAYGLYAEQLSGSPFTAPHATLEAFLVVSHSPFGQARQPIEEDRQALLEKCSKCCSRCRFTWAIPLGPHTLPLGSSHFRDRHADHDHGRRCVYSGWHGGSCLSGQLRHG